jgi:5-methylthioribose kinase
VGFAGTELVRRIIGYAHLTDLETAPAQASRAALRVGRDLIVRRAELTTTESIRALITGYLKEIA